MLKAKYDLDEDAVAKENVFLGYGKSLNDEEIEDLLAQELAQKRYQMEQNGECDNVEEDLDLSYSVLSESDKDDQSFYEIDNQTEAAQINEIRLKRDEELTRYVMESLEYPVLPKVDNDEEIDKVPVQPMTDNESSKKESGFLSSIWSRLVQAKEDFKKSINGLLDSESKLKEVDDKVAIKKEVKIMDEQYEQSSSQLVKEKGELEHKLEEIDHLIETEKLAFQHKLEQGNSYSADDDEPVVGDDPELAHLKFTISKKRQDIRDMTNKIEALKYEKQYLETHVSEAESSYRERKEEFESRKRKEEEVLEQEVSLLLTKAESKIEMYHDRIKSLRNEKIPAQIASIKRLVQHRQGLIVETDEMQRKFHLDLERLETVKNQVADLDNERETLLLKLEEVKDKRALMAMQLEEEKVKKQALIKEFRQLCSLGQNTDIQKLPIIQFQDTGMKLMTKYLNELDLSAARVLLLKNISIQDLDEEEFYSSKLIQLNTPMLLFSTQNMDMISSLPNSSLLTISGCKLRKVSDCTKITLPKGVLSFCISSTMYTDNYQSLPIQEIELCPESIAFLVARNNLFETFVFKNLSLCSHLRYLEITGNKWSSLPLLELNLQDCPIVEMNLNYNCLSDSFELRIHCETLARLLLSNNKIRFFSLTGSLPSLIHLDLSNNNLSRIETLQACSSLESIHLQDNMIADVIHGLCDDFYQLPIKYIDINRNPISAQMDSLEFALSVIYSNQVLKDRAAHPHQDSLLVLLKVFNLKIKPNIRENWKGNSVRKVLAFDWTIMLESVEFGNSWYYGCGKGVQLLSAVKEQLSANHAFTTCSTENEHMIPSVIASRVRPIAATRISAWFKGLVAERNYRQTLHLLKSLQIKWRHKVQKRKREKLQKAAAKIQASFRGHRARRMISNVRVSNDSTFPSNPGNNEDPEDFQTWINGTLTSVEEFDQQIDHFIEGFELNLTKDDISIFTSDQQNPNDDGVISRQYELLNTLGAKKAVLPSSTITPKHEEKRTEVVQVPKEAVLVKKPSDSSSEDSWHFSNPQTIASLQKKQKRLNAIQNQSAKREAEKDPLVRLGKFRQGQQPVNSIKNDSSSVSGSSEASKKALPMWKSVPFKRLDPILAPPSNDSSVSSSRASTPSEVKRVPRKLFSFPSK